MVFSLLILLPVALVCLRAAVAAANRILGPVPEAQQSPVVGFDSSYAQTPDPENPYSAPASMSVAVERSTLAIPELGWGRSLIAVFVQWLASMLTLFAVMVFEMAASGTRGGAIGFFWLIYPLVMVGVSTLILKLILPTTFRRGLLVAVLQIVMAALVGAGVGLVISYFLR